MPASSTPAGRRFPVEPLHHFSRWQLDIGPSDDVEGTVATKVTRPGGLAGASAGAHGVLVLRRIGPRTGHGAGAVLNGRLRDHVLVEYRLSNPEGLLVVPETGVARCAVLVLSGSSGRVEVDRVRLLADRGAVALSIRWFGDAGQPPGICEVPLETFLPALDRLVSLSDQLAVLGVSKGAEAALLLACRDARIRAVGALSPSSVVWANVGPGIDGAHQPYRSSWTEGGVPIPFVPYDDTWVLSSGGGQAVYRGLYEQSLRAFPTRVHEAAIPVERIAGRILLTAGGNDLVWPSDWFAAQVRARRAAHGLSTEVITSVPAGHRVSLPGEPASPAGGRRMARGGTAKADAALGLRVWPALLALLNLS